jgi:hypothetical protein
VGLTTGGSTSSLVPDLWASSEGRLGLGEPALPLPGMGTTSTAAEDTAEHADDEAIAGEGDDDDDDDDSPNHDSHHRSETGSPFKELAEAASDIVPTSAPLKLVYSPRLAFEAGHGHGAAEVPALPIAAAAITSPPTFASVAGALDQRRRSVSSHARRLRSVDDAALSPSESGRETDLAASIASLPSPVPDSSGYPHAAAPRRAHFAERSPHHLHPADDLASNRSGTVTSEDRTEYDSWTGSTATSETDSRFSSSSEMSGDEYDSADDDVDEDGFLRHRRRRGDDGLGDDDATALAAAAQEEYEVDMGALRDKLEQGGGGEVSMRRDARRAGDFKSQLVGGDGRTSATVPLEPFRHQVGGHSHIFRFSKKAVCKVKTCLSILLSCRRRTETLTKILSRVCSPSRLAKTSSMRRSSRLVRVFSDSFRNTSEC